MGRELEKTLLVGTFERSAQQRSCQLVTVVGEPGVGKSRLCAELFAYIEDRPGLVRWRQGRCLPYGEGIAFWALGEIVKAECGILESDSAQAAEAKLEQALRADDPDYAWLKARLAPLVGAGGEPASQEESFTAWRRVLETWAETRETVLVFEDLQWADPALIAFLEHLADWAEGVPLLLLCTARPELYERHPTFGADARNAQRINLAPLSDSDTAQLVSALLERAVLPAETQRALLERAGGNPLYAEEFVRLLADHGRPSGGTEVPESVQALIAARLDTLPAERKSLLQDASVLGKVFWAGALVWMGDRDPAAVELALHELARKELVRPARISSMEGEHEYGFWHVLVRDVCYGQMPRAARAARHQAAAVWIEEKAGERVEDLADVLAYHYEAALELNRAAGLGEQVEQLQAQALRYMALAGERALSLDVDRAEQQLARALTLPRRRSCTGVAARALGAGRAAAGPAAGGQAGARRGRRPLSRQGQPRGGRPRPDPPRARRPPTRRPAKQADARRGCPAARGATRRAGARRRLRLSGRKPLSSRPTTPNRSRPPSGHSRSRRSSACPSRHSRSTGAASPAASLGKRKGSRTCVGRSSLRWSRARDARPPSSTATSPGSSGSTKGRRLRSTPTGRGSPSASGAASPRSRCTCAR